MTLLVVECSFFIRYRFLILRRNKFSRDLCLLLNNFDIVCRPEEGMGIQDNNHC